MVTTGAWAGLAIALGEPGPWVHFTITIVESIILSTILYVVRTRTLYRLERSLIKEERQSKALEVALSDAEAARKAANRANQLKTEFLNNISHEIRTPMNGIIGMTNLTLDSDLAEDQREQLGIVRSSAESLNTIHSEILDLSKIEAGRLELQPEPMVVTEVITTAISPFKVLANDKGIRLSWSVSPEVPPPSYWEMRCVSDKSCSIWLAMR